MGATNNLIVNLEKPDDWHYCIICNCSMRTNDTVKHRDGHRHQESFEKYGRDIMPLRHSRHYFCECCGCIITHWLDVYTHLTGKQHMDRLSGSNKSRATSGKVFDNEFIVLKVDNSYSCAICNCNMSGPIPMKQHIVGDRHTTSMVQYGHDIVVVERLNRYYCKLCKCKISGYLNIWQHTRGKPHEKLRNTKNEE